MANRTERRIRRQEKKYTKAAEKYRAKTGNLPYEAFVGGKKEGKKVRRISKRLGKLYAKPLFAKKPRIGPGKRTAKESIGYGLKAIGAAAAVVGTMLGGKKLVEGIKKKVGEHRLEKFGKEGVGTSYKARQFRKKFRKNN